MNEIWSWTDSDLVQVRAGGPGGQAAGWGHPILGGLSLVRWFALAGWRVEMVDEGCMVLGNTQYWVGGPGPDQVRGLLRWFAVTGEELLEWRWNSEGDPR